MATISLPMDFQTNFQFLLRWIHFLSGIVWIGMLYWFNLVNVNFQKGLDADTKKKINPDLLARTLWWFRWGAVVTVLSGFIFYAVIMMTEPGSHKDLGKWMLLVAVAYGVIYGLLQPAGKPGAARAVGNALNKNPFRDVPCHRVVRSDGSVGGFARSPGAKIALLRREGVRIEHNRVNLSSFYLIPNS